VSELNVVAVLTAKPGSESIVAQALTDLVAPTRAEAGCISYDLYASAADPTVFITVEKWQSQADLDQHMQTAHIATALATAGDHFGAAPAIHPLAAIDAAAS
jgi:quinol monooxygenase YgiN